MKLFETVTSMRNTTLRYIIKWFTVWKWSENGLQFGKVHNKMENVWEHLRPLHAHENRVDLGNYTLIASNEDVVLALKEGLMEAQSMLRVLNMAPSAQCRIKEWFLTHGSLSKATPSIWLM